MKNIKNQEAIQVAVEKYRTICEANVASFEKQVAAKMDGTGEFDIDTIESIWGNIVDLSNKSTEELICQITESISEKDLIVKKN